MGAKYKISVVFAVAAVHLLSVVYGFSLTDLNNILRGRDHAPAGIHELSLIVKSDPVTAVNQYEDYILARWLAANNFDVATAFAGIRANAFWRKDQRIDTILSENFQDMLSLFPYSMDTFDPVGRPVVYINIDQWDVVHNGVQTEQQKNRFLRYVTRIMEEADVRVKEIFSRGNRNVTQFSGILNMGGFTIAKHGSLAALSAYGELSRTVFSNYPLSTERVVLINTPDIFSVAYTYLDDDTKLALSVNGGPDTYEPVLVDYLGRNNIPRELLPLRSHPCVY